jgi:hypothetical protein
MAYWYELWPAASWTLSKECEAYYAFILKTGRKFYYYLATDLSQKKMERFLNGHASLEKRTHARESDSALSLLVDLSWERCVEEDTASGIVVDLNNHRQKDEDAF